MRGHAPLSAGSHKTAQRQGCAGESRVPSAMTDERTWSLVFNQGHVTEDDADAMLFSEHEYLEEKHAVRERRQALLKSVATPCTP